MSQIPATQPSTSLCYECKSVDTEYAEVLSIPLRISDQVKSVAIDTILESTDETGTAL